MSSLSLISAWLVFLLVKKKGFLIVFFEEGDRSISVECSTVQRRSAIETSRVESLVVNRSVATIYVSVTTASVLILLPMVRP